MILPVSSSSMYSSSPVAGITGATGAAVRASMMASAAASRYSAIARPESSLPGMTYSMPSLLQLLSTTATTGMPSLLASATAMYSSSTSITNSASGSPPMSLIPERVRSSLARSRSRFSASFLLSLRTTPDSICCSRSFSLAMEFLTVL